MGPVCAPGAKLVTPTLPIFLRVPLRENPKLPLFEPDIGAKRGLPFNVFLFKS